MIVIVTNNYDNLQFSNSFITSMQMVNWTNLFSSAEAGSTTEAVITAGHNAE